MRMLVYETIQIPNSGGSRLLNSRLCHIKYMANKAAHLLAKHFLLLYTTLSGLMYLRASFVMLNLKLSS